MFNLVEMKNHMLTTNKDSIVNYFNKYMIPELDTIQELIISLEKERSDLLLYYNNHMKCNGTDAIKLEYTERDGYSFATTKLRYQSLLKSLTDSDKKELKIRNNNSTVKFYTDSLLKVSNKIISHRELLATKIKLNYLNTLNNYYIKYNGLFNKLKEFIEILDVTSSNYYCAEKNNYTCPQLTIPNNNNSSGDETPFTCSDSSSGGETPFVEYKQLRHPIIESLGIQFIPNDITLNNDTPAMLVYGVNSSGKSSILRSIGVALIMAQCGLYVPCESFVYYPFDTIISQVDLTDDLFKSKSSFINELVGLKKIISVSNEKTLVLSDELLRGTEYTSASALVATTILTLLKNNTKFLFTTHLHSIPDIPEIKNINDKLNICHLSVSVINNNIVFDRKIKSGSGSKLYGIEVSKNILDNSDFIDTAFKIRNALNNETTTVLSTTKKSKYNSKKIIDKCEICKSTEQLETDHVFEQNTANDKGFLKTTHKNHISNLCILCHHCHLKKTLGKIIVHGYKTGLNGKFLHWEVV
jgi:DNA mismatch repair protein MutS